ncbi:MAG: hypothetical protein LBD64_05240 [Odoribacteraceae bacterium]|jgi:hypothetical protein|nr:hypothetical protein [Odoribacteraceae bacterium]
MNYLKETRHVLPLFALLLLSCCTDDKAPRVDPSSPVIAFVPEEREHLVKVGDSISLLAVVDNATRPVFSWKRDGKIVSTERAYTFIAGSPGDYFVNFRVDAENGSAEEQLKITAAENVPPRVVLPSAAVAFVGVDKIFVAEAENAGGATYAWRLDGKLVSEDSTYTFHQTVIKPYALTLKVTTDNGQDLKKIAVTLLPEQLPELFFDNGRYRSPANASEPRTMTVPLGKSLVLSPVILNIPNPVSFSWKVDGATRAETSEYFTFTPTAEGAYRVTVSEQGSGATAEVAVTCTPPEETYRRSGKNRYATTAFYYMPAPGQFVNSISTTPPTTPAAALAELQKWCGKEGSYFHVGAFGGYYIVGFDHSVENKPGVPDIGIAGNPFAGWCESGIVWVMQDENGNGLPDDTWYELKGSETGKPDTKQRYALTYYKPAASNLPVLWMDNMGRTGSVNRVGVYPAYINESYYTLVGTCLNSTFGVESGLETSKCYAWGYVDSINSSAERPASGQFWIEDAVHVDGSPANLKYIDFVKVHTAVNAQGVAVGEISTESYIPTDLNF